MADGSPTLPSRFARPELLPSVLFALFLAFLAWSLVASGISLPKIFSGLPNMATQIGEMFPPATDRFGPLATQALVTLQTAVVGCVLGIIGSVPLALLSARNTTPHRVVSWAVSGVVSFFRTVPELVWALLFCATVGLGPTAGVLAIAVETMGFLGRFYAEAMEEVDPAPGEAIATIGGGRVAVFACAVLPQAGPLMSAHSLYALEKAVRASMILGLVGAGGIGVELTVAMEMFRWDQACTAILLIFAMVLAVEQTSGWLRRRLIGSRR